MSSGNLLSEAHHTQEGIPLAFSQQKLINSTGLNTIRALKEGENLKEDKTSQRAVPIHTSDFVKWDSEGKNYLCNNNYM